MSNHIRSRERPEAALASDSQRRRWLVLAVTVAAQFMVILDVSVVNVALPSIKHDLHFSQEGLQWVITAYSILFGGALLLGGRLAICSDEGGCSWQVSRCSRSARCFPGSPGRKGR